MSGATGPVDRADSDPFGLYERVRRFFGHGADEDVGVLVERLLPVYQDDPSTPRLRHDGFYWLQTPEWLAESLGLTETATGRELLAELCWIQFCIYGVFRLEDDLIDGETDDCTLAVQANRLLAEASRVAARHFTGTSPFWDVFQSSIDATSRTMMRLDRLQRSPDRPPGIERRLYADLSACLKIASAGVALAADREEDWEKRLSPALDHVAVAAQIVDDLRDLRDDLAAGQINYAAWYLSRPVFGETPEAIEAVVASNLATTDRLWGLLGEATEEMDAALERLGTTLCPQAYEYLRDYREGITGLGERIDRSRDSLLWSAEDGGA